MLNNKQLYIENYTYNLLTITAQLYGLVRVYIHDTHCMIQYISFLAQYFNFYFPSVYMLFFVSSFFCWFLIIHGTDMHIHNALCAIPKSKKLWKPEILFIIHLASKLTWPEFIPWQNPHELTWSYLYFVFYLFMWIWVFIYFTADIAICLITGYSFRLYLEVLHSIYQVIFIKFQKF